MVVADVVVLWLQPDGRCREQEGGGDPRALQAAQGLQEDPRQARQGAGEEVQWQGLNSGFTTIFSFAALIALKC